MFFSKIQKEIDDLDNQIYELKQKKYKLIELKKQSTHFEQTNTEQLQKATETKKRIERQKNFQTKQMKNIETELVSFETKGNELYLFIKKRFEKEFINF